MVMEERRIKRNSILEILRLFAALWVMYYHGYSAITRSQMFSNGRIAVDFFFLLSGFFFLPAVLKHNKTENAFKDAANFVWLKFKPMMITFLICFVFQIVGYIKFYEGFYTSPWGYLWYIPHLLFVFAVYYLLARFIKSKTTFNWVVAVIVVVCLISTLSGFTNFGVVRGFAGVGGGMFIYQIPTIYDKNKWLKVLTILMSALSFLAIFVISVIAPKPLIQDCLYILLLFPLVIYFSAQIPFSNKYVNSVCSISLGLYTYQTVAGLLEDSAIIVNGQVLFYLVLILAVVDVVLKWVIKSVKRKMLNKNAVE